MMDLSITLAHNQFLISPEEKISNLKFEERKATIIAIVAIVAFAALSLLTIWWATLIALEAVGFVTLSMTLLLPQYYETVVHPSKIAARDLEREGLFESRVLELINESKAIESDAALQEEFVNIGADELSDELKSKITEETQATSPYKPLIPLLARAKAHNEVAQRKFEEIRTLFHDESKPYRALIQLQNNRETPPEDREKIEHELISFESTRHRIESEYLEERIRSAFCTYLVNNPYHSGKIEDLGELHTRKDPTEIFLACRYRNKPLSLFSFKDSANSTVWIDIGENSRLEASKTADFIKSLVTLFQNPRQKT